MGGSFERVGFVVAPLFFFVLSSTCIHIRIFPLTFSDD